MADEITVGGSMRMTNGNIIQAFERSGVKATQTTAFYEGGMVTVGTSHEAVPTGDLTTPGFFAAFNNDDTNFVEIGLDDSGVFAPIFKLGPGEFIGPAKVGDSVTLYWQADTADCNVEYLLLDR